MPACGCCLGVAGPPSAAKEHANRRAASKVAPPAPAWGAHEHQVIRPARVADRDEERPARHSASHLDECEPVAQQVVERRAQEASDDRVDEPGERAVAGAPETCGAPAVTGFEQRMCRHGFSSWPGTAEGPVCDEALGPTVGEWVRRPWASRPAPWPRGCGAPSRPR
jgi:hypothetical protein